MNFDHSENNSKYSFYSEQFIFQKYIRKLVSYYFVHEFYTSSIYSNGNLECAQVLETETDRLRSHIFEYTHQNNAHQNDDGKRHS